MKVIVPVGLTPPDSVAVSVRLADVPSVTTVGLGVVVIDGVAALTVTCSAAALFSQAELLLVSPL